MIAPSSLARPGPQISAIIALSCLSLHDLFMRWRVHFWCKYARGTSLGFIGRAAHNSPGPNGIGRPVLLPKANYKIGIGHTFGFLKRTPAGNEITFGYIYSW
jgi:hypothetical protein